MTHIESFADRVRYHTTEDSPHAHQAPEHRSWAGFLKHHWSTLGESA